jgi:hypothetical protein
LTFCHPLRGLRILGGRDPRVTLAALAHPGLLSPAAPRLVAPNIHDESLRRDFACGDACVRKELLKTAVGDPVLPPGQRRDPNAPRVNNGITGDARRSSAAIGKMLLDKRVDYAVKQIRGFLGTMPKATQPQ